MAIYQLDEWTPQVDPTAWVADSAQVMGEVSLAAHSSVWVGAVLRGDSGPLVIGPGSNIQDSCVVHADAGAPVTVGQDVTVGHQVMLHGCTVDDLALIGIGAVVLNHAHIGARCIVGAGAVVTEGKRFEPGHLILGAPAKVVRPLTPEELEHLAYSARHYRDNAARYRNGLKRLA